MKKLTSERIDTLMQLAKVCTRCNGDGFTSEHDCNGIERLCSSRCPIPVVCEACHGEGAFINPNSLRTALESVGVEEVLDKRVIHINATPEFMADPKNIKLINDMVEKAGQVTIKKYDPIELKNLKNPE